MLAHAPLGSMKTRQSPRPGHKVTAAPFPRPAYTASKPLGCRYVEIRLVRCQGYPLGESWLDNTSYEVHILPFGSSSRLERGDTYLTLAHHYNGSNLLTAIVDPIGDSVTLTYTSSKLSTITDPGGRISHFTVDGGGNLTTIKDPTNTTTFSGTYDTHHRLTQVTDRGSNTWLYRYDFASTIASDSTPAVLAGRLSPMRSH